MPFQKQQHDTCQFKVYIRTSKIYIYIYKDMDNINEVILLSIKNCTLAYNRPIAYTLGQSYHASKI